ncbi:FtsK/SpoIIIE domain-containing protein [Streptomyces sp. CA-132043]|uniref:FtsK/SpoIIIE domain-containing protein n=1 Tax=Streptomyces sp. CA-132043 TaxID=3240048 RepID=UPI003D8D66DF
MTPLEVFGYAPILFGAALALIAVWAIVWATRYALADRMTRASLRQAARIRRRWKRLAPMARLSVTDRTPTVLASLTTADGKQPQPRVLTPAIKVKADQYGVMVRANCLPQVSLKEFQKAAAYLADAWRCVRVSVHPDGPGQVLIRGVRVDPLLTPTTHEPTGKPPKELALWRLGMDEYAMAMVVTLSNVPGVIVGGLPGYGKTSLVNGFICDTAPSPLIQFAVADGKVSGRQEGDYADLEGRLFDFVGDDLRAANALFHRMVRLRRARHASLRTWGRLQGKPHAKNIWDIGLSEQWPLAVLIIDEAHTYFRDYKGPDKKSKELAALAAENARLVEDLVKKGRSVGMLVILTTQKTTGDAIPTFIRDVCPVGLSFAQRTMEAAVAALGDDIRDWPDAHPTELRDPAYVGVAVMRSKNQTGFTRIRTPYVADEDAARIAAETVHLTRDPSELLEEIMGPNVWGEDWLSKAA